MFCRKMSFRKDRPTLYKVIVKNLSKVVTKDHIDEIFSVYGPINYLDFIKGKIFLYNQIPFHSIIII